VLECRAPVDVDGKLEAALDKCLRPIPGPQMIAAANAIQCASRIALAKPQLADRIARASVGVLSASYKTAECRNVAIGQKRHHRLRFHGTGQPAPRYPQKSRAVCEEAPGRKELKSGRVWVKRGECARLS